jgi:DNA polymerase-1
MNPIGKEEALKIARILKALLELNKVSKILDSFLPVFLNKTIPKANRYWLHGHFNLGGTVSGRLSSSDPNMQNLPSTGSIYAKPTKKCFSAPDDWLLVGADYNALEARIGALLTKDIAKLCVYTDGYDSHSFNAYGYWKDKMPDIQYSLTQVNFSCKFYRVTQDDGTISYHVGDDPKLKEFQCLLNKN